MNHNIHKSPLEGIPNLNHFLPNHFMKNWPLRGMESPMLQRSSVSSWLGLWC